MQSRSLSRNSASSAFHRGLCLQPTWISLGRKITCLHKTEPLGFCQFIAILSLKLKALRFLYFLHNFFLFFLSAVVRYGSLVLIPMDKQLLSKWNNGMLCHETCIHCLCFAREYFSLLKEAYGVPSFSLFKTCSLCVLQELWSEATFFAFKSDLVFTPVWN